MSDAPIKPSRRRFLKTSLAGGAALTLGIYLAAAGEKERSTMELWPGDKAGLTPDAWLKLDEDGVVTVRVNHTELGQGVSTALPMILAEEMDADWNKVRFEIAPVEPVYKNPAYGIQMTGGSTSVPTSWDILRRAGATVRAMLLMAAAQSWDVPVGECRTSRGKVFHPASGRELGYAALARKAAGIAVPEEAPLKKKQGFCSYRA